LVINVDNDKPRNEIKRNRTNVLLTCVIQRCSMNEYLFAR